MHAKYNAKMTKYDMCSTTMDSGHNVKHLQGVMTGEKTKVLHANFLVLLNRKAQVVHHPYHYQ